MKQIPMEKTQGISAKKLLLVILVACLFVTSASPFAFADDEPENPLTLISRFSDFLFDIFTALGVLVIGWGIVSVALSFQSHDPSQRSNGLMCLAGGLLIVGAKFVLDLIMG